jgi:hypothetical protein
VTTSFVLELVDVVADAVVEVLGKEENVETAVQADVVEAIAKKKSIEVVDVEVEEVVVSDEEEGDEMSVETNVVDVTVKTGGVNVTANVTSTTVVGLSIDCAGCTSTVETILDTLPSQPPRY